MVDSGNPLFSFVCYWEILGRGSLASARPGNASMNWDVANGSVVIAGHKTSVGLGDAFWQATKEIAWARESALSGLGAERDMAPCDKNLSLASVRPLPTIFACNRRCADMRDSRIDRRLDSPERAYS
jgi:predicted DNA-binding ribbon-helix-helix protein